MDFQSEEQVVGCQWNAQVQRKCEKNFLRERTNLKLEGSVIRGQNNLNEILSKWG